MKYQRISQLIAGILVASFIVSSSWGAASSGMMRIAVVDFENRSGYGGEWSIGQGISSMLATALFKSGKFQVVEREKLRAIMKEKKMAEEGITDERSLSVLGKLAGANYIITGDVTEFGVSQGGVGGGLALPGGFGNVGLKSQTARTVVDVRIIDVATGVIVAAEQGSGKESARGVSLGGGNWWDGFGNIKFGSEGWDSSLPGKATRKAVEDLTSKISISLYKAKVIDVDGATVTINMGTTAGAKKGMVLNVIREGKAIVDPDTGAILGRKKTTIGEIKITEVEEKYSTAEIISGDVASGDVVEKAAK